MDYQVFDLKQQPRGATAVVMLRGSAANVRLMDSTNYKVYRAGRQPRFIGGLAKRSPVRLAIPRNGHWYVTVDLQGLRGTVRSGVHVEPPPLAPIRSSSAGSLSHIRYQDPPVHATSPTAQVWDVFISHAGEDKPTVGGRSP